MNQGNDRPRCEGYGVPAHDAEHINEVETLTGDTHYWCDACKERRIVEFRNMLNDFRSGG